MSFLLGLTMLFNCLNCTVMVNYQSPQFGTGVILEGGNVLTCYHVLDTEEGIGLLATVLNNDETVSLCAVIKKDKDMDLVLLEPAFPSHFNGAKLGEPPAKGDEIIIIGCSARLLNSVKTGVVSNIADGYFMIDALTLPGDSGSPVFDGETGKLIGIMQGCIYVETEVGTVFGYGVCIDIETIKEFLEKE